MRLAFSIHRGRCGSAVLLSSALWAAILGLPAAVQGADAPAAKASAAIPGPVVVNRVRLLPADGKAAALVGGRIAGSNTSEVDGFEALVDVRGTPTEKEWMELVFVNKTPYRWVRYEAPAGSHGVVAEVEFCALDKKLSGTGFGSPGSQAPGGSWKSALDGKPETFFRGSRPDGQYVGLDLGEAASVARPLLLPGDGVYANSQIVQIRPRTPGSTIRYTLDGSVPGAKEGRIYDKPFLVDKATTVTAVAFKEGLASSPAAAAAYIVGEPRKTLHSFHVGNSLTGNASRFKNFIRTSGSVDAFPQFLIGGATTERLWKGKEGAEAEGWRKAWESAEHPLDYFTLQPRDFDLDREADYSNRFLKIVREKSPDVQPWLYAEWVEAARKRPSDKGLVPSSQMTKTFPALTWQESMGAMLLYVEEVQKRIVEKEPGGKKVRILPVSPAMGWARTLVDQGKIPGVPPGEEAFYGLLFDDQVHVNPSGCYLVGCVWYAALLRESPEGKMLPIGTKLTPPQARALESLAWDVVRNYPDCGLYEEGSIPCSKPEFVRDGDRLVLRSATPGAWIRYTLDGTTPSRTRGYVYCGAVSLQPGIRLKAVAYQSGMADSEAVEADLSVPPR